MKTVQINITSGTGSTGKICRGIADVLKKYDIESTVLYAGHCSNAGENDVSYMSQFSIKKNALLSRIFGNYGFQTKKETKKMIQALRQIDPQVIHLHNLHGHNCNLQLLFDYIREKHIKVIWTFHDCWAFTAYCPHYDMIGCDRWLSRCHHCPQRKRFSWFFDRSAQLFTKKKQLFAGVDMTIVTPSQWMADQAKKSFLKDNPIRVLHNGIDLQVFCPTESDFRERYYCGDKFIVLGVAFGWGSRKGLDVFCNLANTLPDAYQIVLVGTNEEIDQALPDNIISIHRTQNQQELAQIYTAADVLVNPTREENYPTVNMEALACGTPVITFRTGGSAEMLDKTCGIVVEKNDAQALLEQIEKLKENKHIRSCDCVARAKAFDMHACYESYAVLYKEITRGE